jgi:NTE family protein
MSPTYPRPIGLALGSGSARGWAHIGVIRALDEAGIHPDLICGTSIGALVGAAYAAGDIDHLEDWVRRLGVRDVLSLMDVSLGSGLLKGERLVEFFRDAFHDRPIEQLSRPFAAVATELDSGNEVWLRAGSTVEAVRASIALPGLFAPVLKDGRVLVDGGLVNPVPVSLARAMGARTVIAVDLSADMLARRLRHHAPVDDIHGEPHDWIGRLSAGFGTMFSNRGNDVHGLPSLLTVIEASINIMQVRIGRSRLAGDPPDVTVAPRLGALQLLEFHRAAEAIDEGRRAVHAVLPVLEVVCGVERQARPAEYDRE